MKIIVQPLILLMAFLCGLTAQLQAQTPSSTPPPTSTAPAAAPASATDSTQQQAIDPAKVAEIRKMLEMTGIVKMLQPMVGQLVGAFRSRNPDISPDFWDNYEKQVDVQGLVDKMIPLYDKYYSLEDLKAVNAFYQTPSGQRVLAATPLIMHEAMQVGQDWGRDLGMKLASDVAKERQKEAAAAPTASAAAAAASAIAPAPGATPTPPAPTSAPPPAQ